jgi:hypothetical protein
MQAILLYSPEKSLKQGIVTGLLLSVAVHQLGRWAQKGTSGRQVMLLGARGGGAAKVKSRWDKSKTEGKDVTQQ